VQDLRKLAMECVSAAILITLTGATAHGQPGCFTDASGNTLCTGVRAAGGLACVLDCDGSGAVAIDELIVGVNIALGRQPANACPAFDCPGTAPIDCVIEGVNGALGTCQAARQTPTPSVTPNASPTATKPPDNTATASPTMPTDNRFVDNGDGTVTDTQTQLTWEKKGQPGALHVVSGMYVWAGSCNENLGLPCQPDADAAATCSAATGGAVGCATCEGICDTLGSSTVWQWLNQLNAARFAGYSDWRIPTVGHDGGAAELETIIDLTAPGCGSAQPCVPAAFRSNCENAQCTAPNCSCTQASTYWSATTYTSSPTLAWFANFGSGSTIYQGKGNSLFLRAVRGGP
jgi:uncharacterized protein DUF1566